MNLPKVFTCLAALFLLLSGCTAPDRALRTLTEAGFSNIKVGGYNWFSCGKGDIFATNFQAVGPTGKPVEGTICNGLLKGATIRFN